ncbi:hypothetical protein DPMN_133438 [Dreissena polymorpha]|uniref:Uncharacterized protein n=1 Tax=Dreissena polymorpha TaxID=45954 RepID=A0A9D4FVJ4_DREPO|nr:hypothetical protein DPMN_133438 [Dreissena polymorpha]
MISLHGGETDFNHEFHMKTSKVNSSFSTYVQSKKTLILIDIYTHKVYMFDTVTI